MTGAGVHLLFIHLPKCGGTTVVDALQKWFGVEHVRRLPATTKMHLEELPPLESPVLYGHVPFVIRNLIRGEPTTFTVVREPVSRTLSAYWYIRERVDHPLHTQLVMGGIASLQDFVMSPYFEFHACNIQTRLLGASDEWGGWVARNWANGQWAGKKTPWEGLMEESLDTCLERALYRIQSPRVIVGVQSGLRSALDLLADSLNQSRLTTIPLLNARLERAAGLREEISTEVLELVTVRNSYDVALYERVLQGLRI